jgi:hypothetical protein
MLKQDSLNRSPHQPQEEKSAGREPAGFDFVSNQTMR